MPARSADILIVGGGLGGVAAALAALRAGRTVVLTEHTDWLGGQLTAQAVPPDENPWIERVGGTATYRKLRQGIRDYYRRNYPLTDRARSDAQLNPGAGGVSPLCHEPRVAVAVIDEMLAPYRSARRLEVLLRHVPVAAEVEHDTVRSVTLRDERSGDETTVDAKYVIDATELGDVLPLAGAEHVIGAESQAQTGELHALPGEPDPLDQQAISWCFAVDHLPGEDHTIDRPKDYGFWHSYQADFWPDKQLSWFDVDPITLEKRERRIFDGDSDRLRSRDFWHYRRILYRLNYAPGAYASDITLVNWPQIDYWLGPVLGVDEAEKQKNLAASRQLSLSMLYWMQTEAPRFDGGTGYPGLRLRSDVTDGIDGLAKDAYIRESRRIKAEFTILEQHVGVEARKPVNQSADFDDACGTGFYRIDLHPSTGLRTYVDIASFPFQIPLGALIPVRLQNLLPANKNIGTTHITNGCYRLHPVEWNIGEVAGALAAHCLQIGESPSAVRNTETRLRDFQQLLDQAGVDLSWPQEVRPGPR